MFKTEVPEFAEDTWSQQMYYHLQYSCFGFVSTKVSVSASKMCNLPHTPKTIHSDAISLEALVLKMINLFLRNIINSNCQLLLT